MDVGDADEPGVERVAREPHRTAGDGLRGARVPALPQVLLHRPDQDITPDCAARAVSR